MLASLTRTKTFWVVVVVLLGYGIITWDDDGELGRAKPDTEDEVNLVFEIGMNDSKAVSIQVAIAATLGSGGHLAEPDQKIWDGFRHPDRPYHHRFRARRGERLNAEVANKGRPVTLVSCWFWQEGQGTDEMLPGYGDITGPHLDAVNGGTLARCAAVVR